MQHQPTAPERASVLSSSLASVCSGCRNEIDVLVTGGTVSGPGGSRGTVTYADTDIVVWDCPSCGVANADTLID